MTDLRAWIEALPPQPERTVFLIPKGPPIMEDQNNARREIEHREMMLAHRTHFMLTNNAMRMIERMSARAEAMQSASWLAMHAHERGGRILKAGQDHFTKK